MLSIFAGSNPVRRSARSTGAQTKEPTAPAVRESPSPAPAATPAPAPAPRGPTAVPPADLAENDLESDMEEDPATDAACLAPNEESGVYICLPSGSPVPLPNFLCNMATATLL